MIGRRHSKVVIQERQGDTKDDNAGPDGGNWVDIKTIWGEVLPNNGAKEFEDGQLNGNVPYRVRISFNQNLVASFSAAQGLNTSKKRLKLIDDTLIYIHSVINERMRNKTILITGWAKQVAI